MRGVKHKIKEDQVNVEFKQLSADDEQSPLSPPPEASSEEEQKGNTTIEVVHFPTTVTVEAVEAFFEMSRSGGCEGAVSNVVTVKPGVFHITFHEHKGIT